MKSFDNLIQEVIESGLCHRCGACVAFCSSIKYGALELDSEGKCQKDQYQRRSNRSF